MQNTKHIDVTLNTKLTPLPLPTPTGRKRGSGEFTLQLPLYLTKRSNNRTRMKVYL